MILISCGQANLVASLNVHGQIHRLLGHTTSTFLQAAAAVVAALKYGTSIPRLLLKVHIHIQIQTQVCTAFDMDASMSPPETVSLAGPWYGQD